MADGGGYTYLTVLPTEKIRGNVPYCYLTDSTDPAVAPRAFALFANLENREDSDCRTDPADKSQGIYTCQGRNYCYAITSANATVNNLGQLVVN